MKNQHDDIDDKIRRAMISEEKGLKIGPSHEQGVFESLLGLFKGRLRWLNFLVWFFQMVFIGLAAWSAYRFFGAPEVKNQILFATLFLWGVGVTGLFKIWFWMVMNRNVVMREVKRLELQVARAHSVD